MTVLTTMYICSGLYYSGGAFDTHTLLYYRPVGAKYIHRILSIIHRDTINKIKFSCRHFGVLVTMVVYGAIVKRAYSPKTAVFIRDSNLATDY